MKRRYIIPTLMIATATMAFITPALDLPLPDSLLNWGVIATALVVLTGIAFVLEFETAAVSSKEIALIAMLGTISAVLRVPFAAIPNVQPCTYLIICSGYVFGSVVGFTVGGYQMCSHAPI